MQKLSFIQDNNIMIPKDGNKLSLEAINNTENEFLTHLQDEVRNLHYQLKAKDKIIQRIKDMISSQETKEE